MDERVIDVQQRPVEIVFQYLFCFYIEIEFLRLKKFFIKSIFSLSFIEYKVLRSI